MNQINFTGYKNVDAFLKQNRKVLKKVFIEARKDFSYSINDKFLNRNNMDYTPVGKIRVFKKGAEPIPVDADIFLKVDGNCRYYQLFDKDKMIGIMLTDASSNNDKITLFIKKGFEDIGFMKSLAENEYFKVGRALHDIAKLTAIVDQKRVLTLFALNQTSPVGFHAKNNFTVMSAINNFSEEKAQTINELLRENILPNGVKRVFKEFNCLFMSTVLPKK